MLNNGFKNNDVPVKDTDGNVLSKEADKLARWKEHFKNILNRPEPEQVVKIPPAAEDLDICIDPPTMEEVKAAIKAKKSGQACGADGVTAEMLKAEETETPRLLMCIFREIWERETIPEAWKLVNVIKMLYSDFKCQVICNTALTDAFSVTTGVKQGCILSHFLFILGIDWVLRQVTSSVRKGIRWTLTSVLEDLDYADDIVLLAQHQDMQDKTNALATTAENLGLKINIKKTRHLRMSSRNNESILVNGEVVYEVDHLTFLGSKVSTSGDGEEEILVRISKVSQAFASLRSTWRSKNTSQKSKIRFFKSNVLSTLLYGAESWKMTKTISHKLEVFQNKCLRTILRIYWSQKISNYELLKNRNRTNHTASLAQEMEMDFPCAAHATSSTTTSCP